LDGSQYQVDKNILSPFQITETEAKQFVIDQLNQALEQTKDAFAQYLALLALESQKEGARIEASAQPPLAAMLGLTPQTMEADPEQARQKLEAAFAQLSAFLKNATSEQPARQERAREQMRSLRQALGESGIETAPSLLEIPDRLREDDLETVRQENQVRIAEAFKELTDELAAAATTLGRELDEKLAELEADRGARVDLKTAFNRRGDVDG
jgi:uncharacterized protein YicC (UPF0701 family)